MSIDINLFYTFLGLFVLSIFVIKREWLIERKSFKIILGISISLFLIGIVLHFTKSEQVIASSALLTPLPSLLTFRFFRKLFFVIEKREPEDTYHRWHDEALGADRLFNIGFMMSVIILFAIAIFVMDSLAKTGW